MPDPVISIVMPAYNAARFIENVVHRIPENAWPHIRCVYMINDGSTDATAEKAGQLARTYPAIIVRSFDRNRGYGAAVREGLLLCKNDGCDIAVCLHSDGQYPPEVVYDRAKEMMALSIDLYQGSRIASGTALSGGMPPYKFIANRILTTLENMVLGLRLTDYHSGMLLYARKALVELPFERFSNSFDFDVEVIACARARGLVIREFPIPTHYGDEISHVRPVRYGVRVLAMMFKYLTGKYRRL